MKARDETKKQRKNIKDVPTSLNQARDMYQAKLEMLQEFAYEDHDMISIKDLYPMYTKLINGRVQQRHC